MKRTKNVVLIFCVCVASIHSVISVLFAIWTVNLTHLHKSGGSDAGIDNALRSSLID